MISINVSIDNLYYPTYDDVHTFRWKKQPPLYRFLPERERLAILTSIHAFLVMFIPRLRISVGRLYPFIILKGKQDDGEWYAQL